MLYEALAGEILFRRHVSNDNIQDPAEQSQLCMWRSINAKLLAKVVGDDPADEPAYEAGRNLVAWCLQGDPNDRPTMAQILAHAFFAPAAPLAPVPARKHLFLSHFQKEGAVVAHALSHALRDLGAHAWLDMTEDDLTVQGMKRGVEESDVFVLILTTNVLTREFCRLEIGWALAARKPILLVREEDERFAAFDYDHWRADKVWVDNKVGWTMPKDAACRPYSSLGATPELRAIRDMIDERAATSLAYRRRDFEQRAMIHELLRRAADPAHCSPPAIWRCPVPPASAAVAATALVAYAVYHGAVGEDIATALRDATGGADGDAARRMRWTDDLDAASCVVIVLSAGVLRPGSSSSDAITQTLLRDLPLVFVYSPAKPSDGGWDFGGSDFREARDDAKAAINSHEALVYRAPSSGYEHAAMANEVVCRLAFAARKNEETAATDAAPRSSSALSAVAPDDAGPVAAAAPPVDSKPAATETRAQLPAQLRTKTLEAALAAERERTARLVEEMGQVKLALAAARAEIQTLRAN